MGVFTKIKQRFYQDSLKLMRVSAEIQSIKDIKQAFAFMGTEINKTTRIPPEVLSDEVKTAGPDDLILMVECDNAGIAQQALQEFDRKITETGQPEKNVLTEQKPATLDEGVSLAPDANIAIISVPGQYAAAQTMRALQLGLHVHLFSDNVSLENEIELKKLASKKGLLLMGPDCGTSVIQGIPLCFANNLKRGGIGIVAASGTGAQELSCIISNLGGGISHIIGVGGRDMSKEVGGIMTLEAINLLTNDPETKVLAVISKPPAKDVADKVQEAVKASGKPSVLVFLGFKSDEPFFAATIEEGAAKTLALLNNTDPAKAKTAFVRGEIENRSFKPEQRFIRGFYSGGTLAGEAEYILKEKGIKDFTIIDLGDDKYTLGALHPMIDPQQRNFMVSQAIKDQSTAIILCDVVIGYGSHSNPAEELAKTVKGSGACVLSSVTGTDADPQNKREQERILHEAGIIVYPSNQYAAEAAAIMILGGNNGQ